tara:strand:- start:3114 stop:3893 length:780 start_codon:yes stop_codon:yes gene_type:complete
MKTYDCFIFHDELDFLELRLNILDPCVDKFIITDGNKTFSGNPKESVYLKNKERFSKWEKKIIHNFINIPYTISDPWAAGAYSRNSIMNLDIFEDDDLILNSDLDEIPKPEIIEKKDEWLTHNTHFTFQQKRYVYYLNNYETDQWFGTRAATYKYLKNTSVENIREPAEDRSLITGPIFNDGGWHFTFFGGEEIIKSKIQSYAHTEFNTPEVLENISNNIKENKDPLSREGYRYHKVDIDNSFPDYIVKNQHNLSRWIK